MNTSIHQDAARLAAAAAIGDLTDAEATAWNDHIATCQTCRKLNEEEFAMRNLIKGNLEAESPDPGFEQRIMDKLELAAAGDRIRSVNFFRFNPALLVAAACITLVAIAGLGLLIHGRKPVSTASAVSNSPALPDLAGLPAAARNAITAQSNGNTITGVERDNDNGDISYLVDTKTSAGAESSFTVAAGGALLSTDTTLDAVPGAVRSAILAQAQQASVESVEEDFDAGAKSYVATFLSQQGGERDFTFNEDGTLASIEMNLADLMAPLQAAIKAQAGQGSIEEIDKSFDDDGEISYVATISTPDGRERDFTFNADGTLSSVECTLAELPAPLQLAINNQVGQGTLASIDKDFDGGVITYDASVITPDGRERDLSISEQGRLLSREVAMTEAPAAVQRTISQTVGSGKVIDINQSFDEPSQGAPYEIEGWKDGKPFYFLVSPTGDFLGMED